MSEVKMVTITEEEYNDLKDSQMWLDALKNAGVDNWSGYDFAAEIYREMKGEEDV